MRHLAYITLLILGAFPATAGHARVQTSDEIIEKHIAALGGRPALQKLVSRHATGTVTLSVQGADLSGTYEAYAKAPNKTRVVLKLDTTPAGGPGDMVIDQRFDGVAAVVMNSMQGDTPITGNQLENMRNGSFPSAMLTYKEKGLKVELLPREKLGNQEMIVLQTHAENRLGHEAVPGSGDVPDRKGHRQSEHARDGRPRADRGLLRLPDGGRHQGRIPDRELVTRPDHHGEDRQGRAQRHDRRRDVHEEVARNFSAVGSVYTRIAYIRIRRIMTEE